MHALDCLGVDPFTVRRFVVFFSCHLLIYSFLELQTINDVFFLSLSSVSFVHHPSSLSSSISFISSTLLITFLLVPRHFLSSSTYTRAHSHYPLPTILHYWSTILPPSITIPFHIPFHHPSPSTTTIPPPPFYHSTPPPPPIIPLPLSQPLRPVLNLVVTYSVRSLNLTSLDEHRLTENTHHLE